jgi:large subunit ribosomal protein L4
MKMIELPVTDKTGKKVDSIQIDEASLGNEVRPSLLKQAYVMFHANRRIGAARTKSRGMVKGSTRKLYRQKGTGNARVGNARTVIRKGGGVAFAKDANTGKWRQKMPRRMRQLANRNALLAKLVDSEVKCIDSLDMSEPRTRDLKGTLEALGVDRTCLVAVSPDNRNAALSARNLENVDTIRIDQLNAFELLNHRYLVVDRASLEAFLSGACFSGDNQEAA